MSVPEEVELKLVGEIWKRENVACVIEALSVLGIPRSSDFAYFFERFSGPFGSKTVEYELYDLVDQKTSMQSDTQTVREVFKFPVQYIIMSPMLGHAVLVYDSETGKVFDVDFEGGEQDLIEGKLEPRWESWNEFLGGYFC